MATDWEKAHAKNVEKYTRAIKKIFEEAATEAASLAGAMPSLFAEDSAFSFDGHPEIKAKIKKLEKRLAKNIEATAVHGINAEWEISNKKNDELTKKVFGSNLDKLTPEQKKKYFNNNDKAKAAFIARKTEGLNLSDRVWKYTGQFKEEIEMALDLGIGDGIPAARMATEIKKYLQNPDKLFRRVRDKHGVLHLSKAAKAYHPGRGVYRSSYKNAMRLTRTENNLAYRTSDFARWQQMDFVVGIEIRLSNNHTLNGVPFTDICDDLKGKYPKDFKFGGWHPQCRCHAVPILKTEEEMLEDERRIMAGQPITQGSRNQVGDVPDKFKKWAEDNAEKISKAKSLPYFVRDNEKYFTQTTITDAAAKGVKEAQAFNAIITKPTPLEIAAKRHAERTPDQAEKIQKEWDLRVETRAFANEALKKIGKITDVDTDSLKGFLKSANYKKAREEAFKISDIVKEIQALDKLDDPLAVARKYSMKDAIAVNDAVSKKIQSFSKLSLSEQLDKLNFEIDWVEKNRKYHTWEVASSAYKKEFVAVKQKLWVEQIDITFGTLKAEGALSKKYTKLLDKIEAERGLSKADLPKIQKLLEKAEAERIAVLAKKSGKAVETLSAIKSRFGDALPETLKELDTAINNFTQINPNLKANQDEVNKLMKKLFDDNDLGMDVRHSLLESIYEKGFLNTFQTGTSNGYLGSSSTTGKIEISHARLKMSHRMFMPNKVDLDESQLSRASYEKYGHLLDRNKANAMNKNLTHYGNTQIRFKKDKVLATWTFDDSLRMGDDYYQPSLTSDPKIHSFDKVNKSSFNVTKNDNWNSLSDWQDGKGTNYIELQYHGELTIDCVESITFPANPERFIDESLIKKFQDKGIEIWYIEQNIAKLYQYKKTVPSS